MYKYRVFLLKNFRKEPIEVDKPVSFFTPIRRGEKVILPQHMQELWKMPQWVIEQNTWVVEEVIHQTTAAVEHVDIVILAPAVK